MKYTIFFLLSNNVDENIYNTEFESPWWVKINCNRGCKVSKVGRIGNNPKHVNKTNLAIKHDLYSIITQSKIIIKRVDLKGLNGRRNTKECS